MGMLLELAVPAGLGTGLHEPELVVGVDAELGIHDDTAVLFANGAYALGNGLGLAQGKSPAQGFQFGYLDFLGAAAIVIDDLHVLAAHLTDDDRGSIVTGEDVGLVRGDLAAHDSLTEAVARVDGNEVLAVRAAARWRCQPRRRYRKQRGAPSA